MAHILNLLRLILPRSLVAKWLRQPGFYGDFKTWDQATKELEKRGGKEKETGTLLPHSFRMPIK